LTKDKLGKIKPFIVLVLILTSATITLSFCPVIRAEVGIVSVNPSEGYVGDSVQVTSNITTENGPYTVFFDSSLVKSGTAEGTLVNVSFAVPHAVRGLHNVTVRDGTGEAAGNFTVLTNYSIGTDAPEWPEQLQQNSTTGIFLNVTGGESSPVYSANLTVRTPANTTYWMNFFLATTTEPGHYNATTSYPSPDWTTASANTNYSGTYIVSWLNGTQVVRSTAFSIGVTNLTSYHRGDIVDIRAVDYPPEQNVTITISGVGVSYFVPPFNATTDTDGVVHTNWNVTSDAPIGSYSLSITPVPTSKLVANDTQIFDVPGLKTEIVTLNRANKRVSDIFVKVRDESTNINYTTISDFNGSTTFMLEKGNHTCEAFFKEVKVGERSINVTREQQENFTCDLTGIVVKVIDANNVEIPFVLVELSYNYTTNLDVTENMTEKDLGETNITGTIQFDPLLTNITYTINASRYGEVFNQNNNTLRSLPAIPYENITILCPPRMLCVRVIDASDQPIANATVTAQELMGGPNRSNATYDDGITNLNCTFGRYTVKVYKEEILLNQTTFNLAQAQDETINETIKCQLYGLTVSIKIVDFFGQPIPNRNVILQREGLAPRSSRTQSDGTATFDGVIGGNLRVSVYLTDETQPYVTRSFYVDESTTIEIAVEKYVMLMGFLVETSQFVIAVIIIVSVVILLSVEVYRRKLRKPRKSES